MRFFHLEESVCTYDMDQPVKCRDNAGECLRQNNHGYYNVNGCNCTVVPCPNHFLCGNSRPRIILDSHGGRCLDCNMRIGMNLVLDLSESECPVCMEMDIQVCIPGCTHKLCIDCFRRVYYSDVSNSPDNIEDKCPLCRNKLLPSWAKAKPT